MIDIEALKTYAYDTIGAIHEVHKELGPGLNEKVYQEGFQLELAERNIPFKKELTFHPTYHGKEMEVTYRLDFLVSDDIIVELKSVESLTIEHKAQLFNYMRLMRASVGILVNFYPRFAEIERYFFNPDDNEIYGSDGFSIRKYV
jgi:GxxExxY protein